LDFGSQAKCWLVADVVAAAEEAAVAEAPREAVAVVRAAASLAVAAVVGIAAAAVAALLPCRDQLHAPRRLTGQVLAGEALRVAQARVVYLGRALVSATVRAVATLRVVQAVATLRIVQAPVDRALVLVLVLEHDRESVRARALETLPVADDRQAAICRIS
jgi:hypothetical protein